MTDCLRVVVIGAGAGIFPAHRQGLQAIGAQVAGVYDRDPARAATVARELDCPLDRDLQSVLAREADVAVILAPHPFHAELVIASLQAGKHVLVEKPIAIQVAEADHLIAAARACQRLLAVAFQQRARPEVQAACRLLRQGALGLVQRADVLATWPRRASYFQVAPWRGTWRGEGGGVAINQGQHDLDVLTYLVGPPRRVLGWTRTRLQPIETDDTVQAMVEWPDGAVGSIHLSTAEVDLTQRIEITGTAGRLRLLPGRLEVTSNAMDFRQHQTSPGPPYEAPTTRDLEPIVASSTGHVAIYQNLVRALRGEEPLLAPGAEAAVPLEVANAITYSSWSGDPVELPLDRSAYQHLLAALQSRGQFPRPVGFS